jgi:hypothetical protein
VEWDFFLVSHFDFGGHWAADHPITPAVECQARGGFCFRTFRTSTVVDDAVCSHVCMQEPCNIAIIERQVVEDARPFGILSTSAALY